MGLLRDLYFVGHLLTKVIRHGHSGWLVKSLPRSSRGLGSVVVPRRPHHPSGTVYHGKRPRRDGTDYPSGVPPGIHVSTPHVHNRFTFVKIWNRSSRRLNLPIYYFIKVHLYDENGVIKFVFEKDIYGETSYLFNEYFLSTLTKSNM